MIAFLILELTLLGIVIQLGRLSLVRYSQIMDNIEFSSFQTEIKSCNESSFGMGGADSETGWKEEQVKCPQCDNTFNYVYLKLHIKRVHDK